METTGDQSPHVAILPGVGTSHITPFVQLAKKLVLHHGCSVTFITVSSGRSPPNSGDSFLKHLPSGVNSVTLPPVDIPRDMNILKQFLLTVTLSLPALRTALHDLKQTTRLVSFVTDPFCGDALDVAKEVGVPAFLFVTSNLFTLSLALHIPSIQEAEPDLPDVLKLPGCVPLHRKDFPEPMKDVKSEIFELFMSNVKCYAEPQGILVNSFQELEPELAEYFSRKDSGWPPVYVIGPLLGDNEPSTTPDERAECLKWLDQQPVGSVIYISFGSRAMLTHAQMTEMALGLEMSGQRFLWAIRCPSDKAEVEGIDSDNPLDYLPEGFLERTKEQGLVLPSWAPQLEILSHTSTEGFLTHCGWNSTMESVVRGVAMIAWPICAEQEMNAVYLVEGAKMALRPATAEGRIVKKEEVARVVKELLEGEEGQRARDNVRKLQKASAKALTEDGKSYQALGDVANQWKNSFAT